MKRLFNLFGCRSFSLFPGRNLLTLIAFFAIVTFVFTSPVMGKMNLTQKQSDDIMVSASFLRMNIQSDNILSVDSGEIPDIVKTLLAMAALEDVSGPTGQITQNGFESYSDLLKDIVHGQHADILSAQLMSPGTELMATNYTSCNQCHFAGEKDYISDLALPYFMNLMARMMAHEHGTAAFFIDPGWALLNSDRLIPASLRDTVFACTKPDFAKKGALDQNSIPKTETLNL